MKQKLLSMLPAEAVVALLALVVAVRSATTSQSIRSFVIGPDYSAEYSTDGENWFPTCRTGMAPSRRGVCAVPSGTACSPPASPRRMK